MEPTRNVKGGKGYKKRKTNRERVQPKQDYSINVEEGEGYFATVRRILGGNQVEVTLNNGTIGTVVIPGRMKKGRRGGWIKQNMIVLVNTEHEILKIIRDSDKDSVTAHTMMDKVAAAKSGFCFYDDSSSDDDDELVNMDKSQAADNGKRSINKNETESERELCEARDRKKKEYGNTLRERVNGNASPPITNNEEENEEEESESYDSDDEIQYEPKSKNTKNTKFSRQKQNTRGLDFNIDDI